MQKINTEFLFLFFYIQIFNTKESYKIYVQESLKSMGLLTARGEWSYRPLEEHRAADPLWNIGLRAPYGV